MTESPVIPLPLTQNFPRSQSMIVSKGPELEKWKSRVPVAGDSPMVPKPLFSSSKCVVEAETAPPSVDPATFPVSPVSTFVATAGPTPISPSPSLFPLPPGADGIVASPVGITAPGSLHPSNSINSVITSSSIYSQSTTGNARPSIRPRPASSVYSQNTLPTVGVTAMATSSPRTPTMTNWSSALPGLPLAEVQAHQQPQIMAPMERVVEEPQPSPQQFQPQIQVPRLRSPSLPQDRGNRRRTYSGPLGGSANMHGLETTSIGSRPFVESPEPVSYPEPRAAVVEYEGREWQLQKPSDIHNIPPKNTVYRSHEPDISRSVSYAYHKANKESTSSSYSQTMRIHRDPDPTSPRASMADSHTPIRGPGQRSGWWSDEDEDIEQGRRNSFSYAAIGMKEKPVTEAGRQRARKIKIIVGVSILLVLVIVGVVVGVTVSMR
ncbi:hypothetical protein F5B22DRAFT_593418 [Xylaria bambusicola]|uniref:uncharacterized protein n=1 Tax=Xylaria bambusicola TaxID=326684 RepID=UPI00200779B5|nr:uncharacterized protein F5B22DRAFT_593418 [Xylaria bambusicola]KAI0522227.1 hypothetical protein F5B22DRAFT_593418 [Xylaria bambusicola]